METDAITGAIVDAAVTVHRRFGPGLLERAYVELLAYELGKRGLSSEKEVTLALVYEDLCVPNAYRLDLLVEGRVPVEVKVATSNLPIHSAQLRTYMAAGSFPAGLLLNFGMAQMAKGIRRFDA